MLESEILDTINQGEGAKTEFKRDDIRAETLAKEIVAFANMNGGRILIGVDDDKTISGITRKNLQAWIMDTVIGGHVHPYILPDYEEVNVGNKKVVALTVHKGEGKPYVLKHSSREDIYVRYGDICQLTSREQQARLFESGGLIGAEKFPVHGSSYNELDERRYQEYFFDKLEEKNISDWQQFLANRDFLVGESLYCSYFAYALFGKKPQSRLPQAGARVTVYSGNEMEYAAEFDKLLDLPFVEFRGDKNAGAPIEPSLQDRVISLLEPYISREKMVGTTREREWDYPKEVLRELLVNAFIHRDWTKRNYVRILAYGDRLEVISPGALPNGMTVEKIKIGNQSQRNQNSVRIFRDYGYLEDRGMGIRYKVIPLTLERTGKEPEFEATEEHLKVTLFKKVEET